MDENLNATPSSPATPPPPPPGYSAADVVGNDQQAPPAPTGNMPPPPPGYSAADVVSSQPQQPTQQPQQPSKPDIFSRTYENTPIPGAVDLVNQQMGYKVRRPIDLYHEAVQHAQAGDWTSAAESAAKLVSGGLLAKDNPVFKAAEEIIMHPLNEIKEQYKEARKAGSNPVAAATSGPAIVQGVKDTAARIASDRAAGNPVAAAADSTTALMKSHAVGSIPLIGGAIQQVGGDLDEDLHNKNYSAAIGDILGPLLTLGSGKILGSLKDVEAESKIKPNKLTRAAQTVKEANETAQQALSKVQINDKLAKAVNIGTSFERETAQNQLDTAGNKIKATGDNAPDNSLITNDASNMVNNAHKDLSTNYTTGISQLGEMTNGTTVDYEGSPLHQAALDATSQGAAEGTPLDASLGKARPGSPRVNSMLDSLSDLNKEPESTEPLSGPGAGSLLNEFINKGEDTGNFSLPEGSEGTTPEPTQLTLNDLVKTRHILGERMRKLGFADSDDLADKQVYKKLIGGVDDTIQQLVEKVGQPVEGAEEGSAEAAGDPELATKAREILDQTNTAYKEGIRRFENTDVKSLAKGSVNDVSARLMRGETSIDDINAVKNTIGEDNFKNLGHDSLRRLVADSIDESGNMDYSKFLRTWSKIKPAVRVAMFGPDLATDLTDNLNVATKAQTKLVDLNKQVAGLLTGDATTTLLKDPARIDALSQTIGPKAMGDLGKSILQQKFAEASQVIDPATGQFVKTHFNPDVVLDWWNDLGSSPEVRQKLFTIDEAGATKYNKLMKDLSDVSSVKKLVKYGVLPAVFGGAGLIHSGLGALVAAIAGGGVEATFGSVRNILDSVANRPGTWKTLGYIGRGVDKAVGAAKVGTGIAKSGAKATGVATQNSAPIIHRPLHNVLQSTKSSLGNEEKK